MGLFSIINGPVDIANMALGRVGVNIVLPAVPFAYSPITANTPAGVACSRFYPLARVAVLSEFDWAFARRQVGLYTTKDVITPPEGWAHSYKLPDGTLYSAALACVMPRRLHSGIRAGIEPADDRIPFELYEGGTVSLDGAQCIVTDEAGDSTSTAPFLEYTADVAGDSQNAAGLRRWPAYFVDAVAWRLAAEISIPLSVKPEVMKLAYSMAARSLAEAIAFEGRGQKADVRPDPEFISIRS